MGTYPIIANVVGRIGNKKPLKNSRGFGSSDVQTDQKRGCFRYLVCSWSGLADPFESLAFYDFGLGFISKKMAS